MSKFLKKAIESPFIILLMLLDLLSNIWQKSYDVLTSKIKLSDMFSNIDWSHSYDMIIRVILTVLLWKFYKNYVAFKKKKEADYIRLKNKIIALEKIMQDSDNILKDLFIETRDRIDVGFDLTVKSLNKLGDTSIHLKHEDKEVQKYKAKVNEKMDELQRPLNKILEDWDDDL